jgi:hypothetical protein
MKNITTKIICIIVTCVSFSCFASGKNDKSNTSNKQRGVICNSTGKIVYDGPVPVGGVRYTDEKTKHTTYMHKGSTVLKKK